MNKLISLRAFIAIILLSLSVYFLIKGDINTTALLAFFAGRFTVFADLSEEEFDSLLDGNKKENHLDEETVQSIVTGNFEFVHDSSIPKGEVHFVQNGKLVGRIVDTNKEDL